MPIEIINPNTGKKTTQIEPGMFIRAISKRFGNQRLAVDFYCSQDDRSGYVNSQLLQVETRWRLGPIKIGEKRTPGDIIKEDFSNDGDQSKLALNEKIVFTATFHSKKLDL